MNDFVLIWFVLTCYGIAICLFCIRHWYTDKLLSAVVHTLIRMGEKKIIEDQPALTLNTNPAVWEIVIADMQERDKIGKQRYGTRLQPFNGRDALVDAYQEALDMVVYLRQAIYERDNAKGIQP